MIYRVLVNGQNFLVELDGALQNLGFYATRFVEAENETVAEEKAIELFRSDTYLQGIAKNDHESSPMLFVEEMDEVDGDEMQSATGFSWYTEEGDHETVCREF